MPSLERATMPDLQINARGAIREAEQDNQVMLSLLSKWERASEAEKEQLKKNYGPLIAEDIPKFQEEVKRHGGLPIGFSASMEDLAYTCLKSGYTVARVHTWFKAQRMRDNVALMSLPWSKDRYYSADATVRRYNGIFAVAKMHTSQLSEFGVIDWKEQPAPINPWGQNISADETWDQMRYSENMRSSYSNCPTTRDTLIWNSTHVAVGFNDLTTLLKAKFSASIGDQSDNAPGADGTHSFRFVGVDGNPYSVAKTEIIADMIQDKEIPASHAIQVWFSATLTAEALTSFTKSVKRVQARYRERIEKDDIERELNIGALVRACGLLSEQGEKLNGKLGRIVEKVEPSGRWRVKMKTGVMKALKADNLTAACEEEEPTSENEIKVGYRVRAEGLQSETGERVNGYEGVVISWNAENERFCVDFDREFLGMQRLKPANLRRLPQPWDHPECHQKSQLLRVFGYIDHWHAATTSSADNPENNENSDRRNNSTLLNVEEARRAWWNAYLLEPGVEQHFFSLGSLQRQKDRIACARYLVSGDLFCDDDEVPSVGNVVMWNVPNWAPKLERKFALGVLAMEDFITQALGLEQTAASSGGIWQSARGFMGAALGGSRPPANEINICQDSPPLPRLLTDLFRKAINETVRKHDFEFEFHCNMISLDNLGLIEKIGDEIRPQSMSWSNVVDYIKPTTFHKIARRCSIHGGCLHMGYSMNWSTEYHGARIIDYTPHDKAEQPADVRQRCEILDEVLQEPGYDYFHMTVERQKYAKLGETVFLTTPLRDDPENLADVHLCWKFYRDWVENHFMAKGRTHHVRWHITEENTGLKFLHPVMIVQNPLQGCGIATSFVWTYDPKHGLVGI